MKEAYSGRAQKAWDYIVPKDLPLQGVVGKAVFESAYLVAVIEVARGNLNGASLIIATAAIGLIENQVRSGIKEIKKNGKKN